jgi:hypothetical protein
MRVQRTADVFEGDVADFLRKSLRPCVEWQQAWMLDLVASQHLLHQQQRVRSDMNGMLVMGSCPLERCQQRTVLRDVIGRDADRLAEFVHQVSARALDANAVSCGARIAARTAVDVDHERVGTAHGAAWRKSSAAAAVVFGVKYRMR